MYQCLVWVNEIYVLFCLKKKTEYMVSDLNYISSDCVKDTVFEREKKTFSTSNIKSEWYMDLTNKDTFEFLSDSQIVQWRETNKVVLFYSFM